MNADTKVVDKKADTEVVDKKADTKAVARMTIKDIMNEFGLTYVYVSRCVQKGWLKPVHKVVIHGGKGDQFRYEVDRNVVLAWRKRCDAKARRSDGRRKYNIYLTADEKRKLDAVLDKGLDEVPLQLANPPKNS